MIRVVAAGVWLAVAGPAVYCQQISYSVTFDDPNQVFADYYQPLTRQIQAAGGLWSNYLRPPTSVGLEVLVKFDTEIPRATCRSFAQVYTRRTSDRMLVYEQGAGSEVRTGIDPNGSYHDIELTLNPDYLRNELWLDPDPVKRAAAVPTNRTDAVSVMQHELGHALAFIGWRKGKSDQNGQIGDLPSVYMSTFDQHVTRSGDTLFFNGPNALAQYGRPVPITWDNYSHIGNKFADPGET